MSAEEFQAITALIGSLSLTSLLFVVWQFERRERLKCQEEKQAHLQEDINKLEDTIDFRQEEKP